MVDYVPFYTLNYKNYLKILTRFWSIGEKRCNVSFVNCFNCSVLIVSITILQTKIIECNISVMTLNLYKPPNISWLTSLPRGFYPLILVHFLVENHSDIWFFFPYLGKISWCSTFKIPCILDSINFTGHCSNFKLPCILDSINFTGHCFDRFSLFRRVTPVLLSEVTQQSRYNCLTTCYCLPKGDIAKQPMKKGSFVPKNVPGVGWGGVGGSWRGGVGWVVCVM